MQLLRENEDNKDNSNVCVSEYANECLFCKNYISDVHVGFSGCRQVKEGEKLSSTDNYYHYFIFILEGEMMLSCGEFKNHLCRKGEMVFIAQYCSYVAEAVTDVKYILLSFDNQFVLCDNMELKELYVYRKRIPVFNKIDIRPPLHAVLESVLFYLEHNMRCKHFHSIKQEEIFLILRSFYTKEEMSSFLSPILNKQSDSKNLADFVLHHFEDVKTVEELAQMCKISVRSFNRKFKEAFGDSPYSWMLKQKSRVIKKRLADEKTSLKMIVKEYGFSSQAHLTVYCKKQFGETPSRLRKQLLLEARRMMP